MSAESKGDRPIRVTAVTGSRADYGLLQPLLSDLDKHSQFELQLVCTGQHLSPNFGNTVEEIRGDGIPIAANVEMLLDGDSEVAVAKSLGLGTIGMTDALMRLESDLLLVLGDRFEILAAVQAALILRIPVAHLAGGDVTEGAFDDSIRHAITKMAHLHFVTNEDAKRRVLQMGEAPERVHNVGSTGIDRIRRIDLLERGEVNERLGFRTRSRNLLVTFHPPTIDTTPAVEQVAELLHALDKIDQEIGIVFTGSNADPAGRAVLDTVRTFVTGRENAVVHTSLGHLTYLSTMALSDAVVGNSSSGIYEAPYFGVPTVNIGTRQKGRPQAKTVINCRANAVGIADAIREALARGRRAEESLYGDGHATERIIEVLCETPFGDQLIAKAFVDQ